MLTEIWDAAAFPAVIWVALTSLLLLISPRWQWSIISLALQYAGIFVLVAQVWSVEMAAVKLVAGWMACAVLAVAIGEASGPAPDAWRFTEKAWPSGRIFRLLAASLVWLTVLSSVPKVVDWIPGLSTSQTAAGLLLFGTGLLQLGLTSQPLRITFALLTILAGFEIMYSAVESSTLVAGLLAAITLGLALIGAYLMLIPAMEETA